VPLGFLVGKTALPTRTLIPLQVSIEVIEAGLEVTLSFAPMRFNTNPNKLLYESPHPGLLPLEKVTMKTYWDWCNTGANWEPAF